MEKKKLNNMVIRILNAVRLKFQNRNIYSINMNTHVNIR